MGNNKFVHTALGLLFSVICLYFFSLNINLQDFEKMIIVFETKQLLFGIISLSLGYVIRVFRWRFFLKVAGYSSGLSLSTPAFLGSMALNNIFPLRAGDLLRTFVFPSYMKISKSASAGSLIIEKIFDLSTITLFLLLSGLYLGVEREKFGNFTDLIFLAIFLVMIIVIFLWLVWIYSGKHKIPKVIDYVASMPASSKILLSLHEILKMFLELKRFKISFKIMIYSCAIWIFESGLYFFILVGLGHPLSFFEVTTIMCVCTLATLIPSSPGYFGTFHLAAFGAITLFGLDSSIASLSALAIHICLWVPTTIAGLVGIVFYPELLISFKAIKAQKKRFYE